MDQGGVRCREIRFLDRITAGEADAVPLERVFGGQGQTRLSSDLLRQIQDSFIVSDGLGYPLDPEDPGVAFPDPYLPV